MSTDRLDGGYFTRRRNFDFQLDRTLEVHSTRSLRKAGADVVMNMARVELQVIAGAKVRRRSETCHE